MLKWTYFYIVLCVDSMICDFNSFLFILIFIASFLVIHIRLHDLCFYMVYDPLDGLMTRTSYVKSICLCFDDNKS